MEIVRHAFCIQDGYYVDRAALELPRPGVYWEDDLYEITGAGKDICNVTVTLYDTVLKSQREYHFDTYASCIDFMMERRPYGFAYKQDYHAILVYVDDWSLEFLNLVDRVDSWVEHTYESKHGDLIKADKYADGLDEFNTLFECRIKSAIGYGTLFQAALLLQHGFRGSELFMCSDEYFDVEKFGAFDTLVTIYRVVFTDIDAVHKLFTRAGLTYPNTVYRQIMGKGFDVHVADS